MSNLQESLEFEALYDSLYKCKRGKTWKASVARFFTHGIEETLKLEAELKAGTYKPRKPHTFTLTYPKVRPCSSTHIRDRVVQRSMNDNVIYPAMTKSFIWDNMACQKGKGTSKARDRLDHMLKRYYINNGNSNKGWVLQCDVHGYYKHMRHSDAEKCFARNLDAATVKLAMSWLQRQYPYDVGYEPGSQMVQILGISMLNPMDHAAKEQMRARNYGRYMDDFHIVSNNKEFLEACMEQFKVELAKVGMEMHPEKSRIYPLSDGILFLGFTYRLTETGKVIRIINPKNVKHERVKLYRLAQMVAAGERTERQYWDGFESWAAHANQGNSYHVVSRTRDYAKQLLEGIKNESSNPDKIRERSS